MNITRKRLKQIISEELDLLSEVKNEEVQLVTMQANEQNDAVNNSSDEMIIQQIQKTIQGLAHLVSGLSDGAMRGACTAPLNSFQQVFDAIGPDVAAIGTDIEQ